MQERESHLRLAHVAVADCLDLFAPDGKGVITDEGILWPLEIVQQAVPPWLPELAEALGGLRLINQQDFESVPADQFTGLYKKLMADEEDGNLALG